MAAAAGLTRHHHGRPLRRREERPVSSVVATYLLSSAKRNDAIRMAEEEVELKSDSRLLYPTLPDELPDTDDSDELMSSGARYLFPIDAFESDETATESKNFGNTGIVRNSIIQDMITLLINRVVAKATPPETQLQLMNLKTSKPLLSRDDIIKEALAEARITHKRLTRGSLNTRPKIPPIKPAIDPDIRQMIRTGKDQGYSEAAMLKTKKDSEIRRLLVPSKEEMDTVQLWKLEEKYRSSISKLHGYTT